MSVMTEFDDEKGLPVRGGEPFKFFASLCKFPLTPGSYASRELMYKIGEAGEENGEIYLNKIL
jgi:hypothetical protein